MAGVLSYRGYPIEQLAQESTYLEVSYLLYHGELPTSNQLDDFRLKVKDNMILEKSVKKLLHHLSRKRPSNEHANHISGLFVVHLSS